MYTQYNIAHVSIVMAMYNSVSYINEAIKSVINQTFQDWELLVVDDGSTDGSAEIVKDYAKKDSRIILLTNNSGVKGAGAARNVGIDNARGEYVAAMDSDDISLPNRLEVQVAFMDKHPDVVMSGCSARTFGNLNKVIWGFPNYGLIKSTALFRVIGLGPTIIFRRNSVKERYPTQFKRSEDTYFFILLALRYRVAMLPRILYHYRVRGDSLSQRTDPQYIKAIYPGLLEEGLGFTPSQQQIDAHFSWQCGLCGLQQWRWILYVLAHARYKLHERLILEVGALSPHAPGHYILWYENDENDVGFPRTVKQIRCFYLHWQFILPALFLRFRLCRIGKRPSVR